MGLTVTDDDGAPNTLTKSVVVGPVPNTPPTASFQLSCAALTCSVNGSGSTDPDGTIASYAWNFGDGGTAAGVTASHIYPAAGTYPITLTVTDDDGAPGSSTSNAVVTATPPPIAADAFARTVSSGWGTADVGGPWTASNTTLAQVTGGRGTLRSATAGSGPTLSLNQVSSSSTDMRLLVAADKPSTGGGYYVSALGRRIASVGDYRGKIKVSADGSVAVSIGRVNSAGAETTISSAVTVSRPDLRRRRAARDAGPGGRHQPDHDPGQGLEAGRRRAGGLAADRHRSTAGFQVAGAIGIQSYLSSSATNAPLVISVDDLAVGRP